MDFLRQIFGPSDAPAQGRGYLGNPAWPWLGVISDTLIASAYFAISLALLWFVRKRRDPAFRSAFVLLGTLIAAAGALRIMEAGNLWHSPSWLAGALKAATAVASLATAIALARIIPRALELASPERAKTQPQSESDGRPQADAELRNSAARFRKQSNLLELIHDAIFVCNLNGEIVFCNRAAESLYGWQKDEVQGRVLGELLQTEFPDGLALIEAAVLEKGYWEGELKEHKRDGGTVIVSSRWALHRGENGEPDAVLKSNRDLTELKYKELRFQSLLEAAADAIVIVNGEGEVQISNAQTEKLFGYSRAELLGLPVEVLLPNCIHGEHFKNLETRSRSPQPRAMAVGLDLYGRHKSGAGFPVEISSSSLATAAGALISSCIRDVTERKQFELKLRETEQGYRILVEGIKDCAIVGLDTRGVVSSWNAGAERAKGYTAQEIIGRHFSCFYPPHVASHVPDEMLRRASREGEVRQEGWRVRKDGSTFWADVAITALRDDAGTLIGFVKITRDITERRRLEQQLREANELLEHRVSARTAELASANAELRNSQELLRMAHNIACMGTFEVDRKTETAFWSSEMEKIYGFKPGQFDRRLATWRSLIHPDDLAQADRYSAKSEKERSSTHTEFRIFRSDGQTRWIASRAQVLSDSSGEMVRVVGVNLDITEQRTRQEEIFALNASLENRVTERTAELVRTNSELESFSYSVSHDLRAPLRHIDGFARILQEDFADQLPAEGHRYLDRIVQSATHMGQLVDDLLNLAHIGRKELSRQSVKMSDLVKSSIADLHIEPARPIEWRIENLPELNCDPGLVKLVFVNLLSNAAKFTRRCSSALIEVGWCKTAGIPTIYVRDNGVGFDPQYADKLFGVFQRLHRQEDFEGTGIGLATVQRIVQRHGGRIWAQSSADCGATFFFTLSSEPQRAQWRAVAEVQHV